jgi:hypothetical protein
LACRIEKNPAGNRWLNKTGIQGGPEKGEIQPVKEVKIEIQAA